MTILAQNFPSHAAQDDAPGYIVPLKLNLHGNKTLIRWAMQLLGAVFVISAMGLWVVPSVSGDPVLLAMKFGVSLLFTLIGLACLSASYTCVQPQAFFDPIRRELRVLHMNESGRPETVLRRSYDALGGVRIGKDKAELWDLDGSLLVTVPYSDPEVRASLRAQLSGVSPI